MDDEGEQDSMKRTADRVKKKYVNNMGIGQNEDMFLQAKVKYFDLITSNGITAVSIIEPSPPLTRVKKTSPSECRSGKEGSFG